MEIVNDHSDNKYLANSLTEVNAMGHYRTERAQQIEEMSKKPENEFILHDCKESEMIGGENCEHT